MSTSIFWGGIHTNTSTSSTPCIYVPKYNLFTTYVLTYIHTYTSKMYALNVLECVTRTQNTTKPGPRLNEPLREPDRRTTLALLFTFNGRRPREKSQQQSDVRLCSSPARPRTRYCPPARRPRPPLGTFQLQQHRTRTHRRPTTQRHSCTYRSGPVRLLLCW